MKINSNKLKYFNKLSIILFTNNERINFIFRALDNYDKEYGIYNLKIIISDSGSFKGYEELNSLIIKKKYNLNIKLIHYSSQDNSKTLKGDAYGVVLYPYVERFKEAIKLINTRYIVLAADDDFYLPGYFLRAISFLEINKDYGSVYGHMLKFTLASFIPYGKIIKIFISSDNNPPNPWLEDDKLLDRLDNLSKHPWSWFSWYAVQRTSLFRITLKEAANNKIDGYLFEKFVSFCHAVLFKAKKIDFIYSARQEVGNNFEREPFSYKKNILQLDNFKKGCLLFLIKNSKLKYRKAKIIVNKAIKKDFFEYKKNDKKEFLRNIRKNFIIFKVIQKFLFRNKKNFNLNNKLVYLNDINKAKDQIDYLKKILEK